MADPPFLRVTNVSTANVHVSANQKGSKIAHVSDHRDHDNNIESIKNMDQLQPVTPSIPPLGVPSQETLVYTSQILTALLSIAHLAAAVSLVRSSLDLSWRLSLTRQLQIIGFMVSVMHQCFKIGFPYAISNLSRPMLAGRYCKITLLFSETRC